MSEIEEGVSLTIGLISADSLVFSGSGRVDMLVDAVSILSVCAVGGGVSDEQAIEAITMAVRISNVSALGFIW